MTIFFSASIHGIPKHGIVYSMIADEVVNAGNTLQAEHIFRRDAMGEDRVAVHKKLIEQIKNADALFAEASYSSISVGYFIALAEQMNKPVVIFYSGDSEPHIFSILEKKSEKVLIVRYTSADQLKKEIPFVLDFVNSSQDVRFNFFVSPSISSYLDWIARSKKVPRSVYLRQLIDRDMALHPMEES